VLKYRRDNANAAILRHYEPALLCCVDGVESVIIPPLY